MTLPRFYCPLPLQAHTTLELPDALAHHALRVLRLRDGAGLVLFDGLGGQYQGTLRAEGRKAWAELGAHQDLEAELPGSLTLAQGLPSGDKMDWIVEKAVELGARRLVPLATRRSVLQLSGERLERRLQHWRRIAQAASEQCGRNRLMEIAPVQTLAAWLAASKAEPGQTLICRPETERTLQQALDHKATHITLLVGPEGGWSEDELEVASRHALTEAKFGQRVLRTETAGLALLSAVSALRGWH